MVRGKQCGETLLTRRCLKERPLSSGLKSSLKADSAAFLLLNPGKVPPTMSLLGVSMGVQASLSTRSLRSEHQLDQRSSPCAIL